MARSSKLALVTLLTGLLSLASVCTVSADNYCAAGAQEQCVVVSVTQASADVAVLVSTGTADAGPTA